MVLNRPFTMSYLIGNFGLTRSQRIVCKKGSKAYLKQRPFYNSVVLALDAKLVF